VSCGRAHEATTSSLSGCSTCPRQRTAPRSAAAPPNRRGSRHRAPEPPWFAPPRPRTAVVRAAAPPNRRGSRRRAPEALRFRPLRPQRAAVCAAAPAGRRGSAPEGPARPAPRPHCTPSRPSRRSRPPAPAPPRAAVSATPHARRRRTRALNGSDDSPQSAAQGARLGQRGDCRRNGTRGARRLPAPAVGPVPRRGAPGKPRGSRLRRAVRERHLLRRARLRTHHVPGPPRSQAPSPPRTRVPPPSENGSKVPAQWRRRAGEG
jgi:hypothetical protein